MIDDRFFIGVMYKSSLTSSRFIAAAVGAHFERECSTSGGDI
jgi:hypothetical protein